MVWPEEKILCVPMGLKLAAPATWREDTFALALDFRRVLHSRSRANAPRSANWS